MIWWQATIWHLSGYVLSRWALSVTVIRCYDPVIKRSWYRLNVVVAAWETLCTVLSRLGLHIAVVVRPPLVVEAMRHRDARMLHLRLTVVLSGCCVLGVVMICRGWAVVGASIWTLRNSLRLNV